MVTIHLWLRAPASGRHALADLIHSLALAATGSAEWLQTMFNYDVGYGVLISIRIVHLRDDFKPGSLNRRLRRWTPIKGRKISGSISAFICVICGLMS